MIALFLMGLVGTAVILGAVPVVAYALMLETCAARVRRSERRSLVTASSWAGVPPSFRPVANLVG